MKSARITKNKTAEIKNVIQRRDKQIAGCMLAMLATLFLSGVAGYNDFYILSSELDFRATVYICIALVFAVGLLQQDRVEKEEQVTG